MIAVIDYGMGNLRSVQKALEQVGHPALIAREPRQVEDASHVVLPGVGGFPECMRNLTRSGLIDVLYRSIEKGKPFLGICLGLQLLFSESEEFGVHPGLRIVEGRVVRFQESELKVPHMGWNRLRISRDVPLFEGIDDGSYVYFVHSYYAVPQDRKISCATTDYGVPFTSAIQNGHLHAVQFHPEKSQEVGLRMLKNFGNLA